MQAKWKLVISRARIEHSSGGRNRFDHSSEWRTTTLAQDRPVPVRCPRCCHRSSRGTFPAEYINGAGNSLVIVPVNSTSLIFANVIPPPAHAMQPGNISGGKPAGRYFLLDSLAGKTQSACHPIPPREHAESGQPDRSAEYIRVECRSFRRAMRPAGALCPSTRWCAI